MATTACSLQQVIDLYSDLASNPSKDFGWEKGKENASKHGYDSKWLESLRDEIWEYCAAVGNPFALGAFSPGDTVLDLGCGAGIDVCVAGTLVGDKGHVIGVDITPKMVEKSRYHAQISGLKNVDVREGSLETLPIDDESIDIVISNGAINLASSKEKVFKEVFRVLKEGGKLYFADMIDVSESNCLSSKSNESACCSSTSESNWANCVEGTLTKEALIRMMIDAGFSDVQCRGINHYTTSTTTRGATFSAIKKSKSDRQREHWENVYTTKDVSKVGWFQEEPAISLALLKEIGSNHTDAIIDVGAGASVLVDRLISLGYRDLSVLDISQSALEIVKKRLADHSEIPNYFVGDVCCFNADTSYRIWHDRAVFHFLQEPQAKKKYFQTLKKHLAYDGYAIIGTFAKNGPDSCSGLRVQQYDTEAMGECLGGDFEIKTSFTDTHTTPSGTLQEYIYFVITPQRQS